jgi:hypothetical protein
MQREERSRRGPRILEVLRLLHSLEQRNNTMPLIAPPRLAPPFHSDIRRVIAPPRCRRHLQVRFS